MNPRNPTERSAAKNSRAMVGFAWEADAVMVNCAASATAPVARFDTTNRPDWPVAVKVIPAGMFPEESVVNVAEPAGQPVSEARVMPDSKQ
jgi:hypothetical protein